MRVSNVKWLWLALLPLLLTVVSVKPAWAAGPVTLELQAPKEMTLGDEVTLTAVLRDSKGSPIPGAIVILWTSASFLSKEGSIELGRAITDSQGRVTFPYEARSENSAILNASFTGDSQHSAAQTSAEIAVQGSAQLYQSTAGVRVPGLGVWLLAVILGGVWSIYLAIMVLLTLIARESPKAPYGAGGHRG